MKAIAKRFINTARHWAKQYNPISLRNDVDSLYTLLYHLAHDLDHSIDLCASQTRDAFASQWANLESGQYLLSDPWFREHVDRILCYEELQIKPEWFRGKDVLDAGCGNGRWSYGFAKLGANVTSVDVNRVAVDKTRNAIRDFDVGKVFVVSSLENLVDGLPAEKRYDLVFSWGVVHHTQSLTRSLEQLARLVKPDGILYLYLYGRESLSFAADLELFKKRVYYNTLPTGTSKYEFLFKKARGDASQVHNVHDIYAPLVNRRLDFTTVHHLLRTLGFADIVRTIDHTDLFIRAIKSDADAYYKRWVLPKKPQPPYWFQHHQSTGKRAA